MGFEICFISLYYMLFAFCNGITFGIKIDNCIWNGFVWPYLVFISVFVVCGNFVQLGVIVLPVNMCNEIYAMSILLMGSQGL